MDPRRFDELSRWLARTLPRRTVLEGSAGAWLFAALTREVKVFGKRKRSGNVRAKACTPNGKKCGRGNKLTPCSKCCSGFNITTRSKKKKCACRPDGADCSRNAQCCAEVCFERHCGAMS